MSEGLKPIAEAFAKLDKDLEKLRSMPPEFMDTLEDQLHIIIDSSDFLREEEKKRIKEKIKKNWSDILIYQSLDYVMLVFIPKGMKNESALKIGESILVLIKIARDIALNH